MKTATATTPKRTRTEAAHREATRDLPLAIALLIASGMGRAEAAAELGVRPLASGWARVDAHLASWRLDATAV